MKKMLTMISIIFVMMMISTCFADVIGIDPDTGETYGSVIHKMTASAGEGGTISPEGVVSLRKPRLPRVKIQPNDGYVINEIIVTPEQTSNELKITKDSDGNWLSAIYYVNSQTEDFSIHATFKKIKFEIEASSNDLGTITPNGNVVANLGSTQKFTLKPNVDCRLSKLIVNDKEVDLATQIQYSSDQSEAYFSLEDIKQDYTIEAEFEEIPIIIPGPSFVIKTHNLSIVAGEGGSITPNGNMLLGESTYIVFVVKADEGYEIDKVTFNGSETFDNLSTELPVGRNDEAKYWLIGTKVDLEVVATFKKIDTISSTTDGNTDVTTSTTDGNTDSTSSTTDGNIGTTTSTTDGNTDSTSSTTDVNIGTTTSTTSGNTDSTTSTTDNNLDTTSSNTNDDSDDKVADSNGNPLPVKPSEITADTQNSSNNTNNETQKDTTIVSVKQEQTSFIIEADYGKGGKVSPSEAKVEKGKSVTFTVTPDKGYYIKSIKLDSRTISFDENKNTQTTTCTLKDIDEDGIFRVKFEKIEVDEKDNTNKNSGNKSVSTNKDNSKENTDVSKFEDVKTDDWFYENVKYVVENKLFNGVSENIFAPNSNLNRGMLVTVLYRLDGAKDEEKSSFEDVADDMYYSAPIAWAAKNNLVNGVGNNQFKPNDNISRQDLSTIIFRYAQMKKKDLDKYELKELSYNDKSEISQYALKAISWCTENKVLNGRDGNIIDSKGLATRAETAAIIQRISNILK